MVHVKYGKDFWIGRMLPACVTIAYLYCPCSIRSHPDFFNTVEEASEAQKSVWRIWGGQWHGTANQWHFFACTLQYKKPDILEDNSNTSVDCDCPNCNGCNVWFCWPCAWLSLSGTDCFCPGYGQFSIISVRFF